MFARGRQLSLLSSCALLLVCLLPGQPAAQEVEAAQASSTDVAADQQFVPPSAVLSQPTVSSQKLLAQGASDDSGNSSQAGVSAQAVSSVGYCHYNSATKTYSPITRANFVGFYHLLHIYDCCTSPAFCLIRSCGAKVQEDCTCLPGWEGIRCNTDLNECATAKGGCAQICTNTPGSFTCSCQSGWTLAEDKKGCVPNNVNACTSYPCKNGTAGPAVCTDLPNPAPNSAAGRTCSCQLATSYFKSEEEGCVDINACTAWPCKQGGAGGAASCVDVTGGANTTAGRTCTCGNGGAYSDAAGCSSVEVDACLSYPCQNGTAGPAVCTDLPNPAPNSAAGRTCSCQSATSYFKSEEEGCVDINACTAWPCKADGAGGAASCVDVTGGANTTAGRTCTCANGGVYSDAAGCPVVEIDACLSNPCQNGTAGPAVCTDLLYPAPDSTAGRTCSCEPATSYFKSEADGCVDIDACTAWHCKQDGAGGAANCTDVTGGANTTAGRTCICDNGGAYSDAAGCPVVEIDACLAFPCKNGTGGASQCTDLAYPAPNNTAGRSCSCDVETSSYTDDVLGCEDINACTAWPCNTTGISGVAECVDLNQQANSTDGRVCTCTGVGVFYDGDLNGCSPLPIDNSTIQVNFSSTDGGSASVPGVTEVTLPAGAFDDGSSTPATVTLTPVSAVVEPTLAVAAARYDVVSTASKVVTIWATQQPKTAVWVKLLQGGANPFKASLGPSDELRVSYVNTFPTQLATGGSIQTTTLELLPDRIPVDLADSISVKLPIWAFRRVPDAPSEPGALRYRADLVLTASRTGFGGRRRLLSSSAPRKLLRFAESPVAPVSEAFDDSHSSRSLLSSALPAPGSCSTNARPKQQCPVGWDDQLKQFLPSTLQTTPAIKAASVAAASRGQQRKQPSRIPNTVSSLARTSKAAATASAQSASLVESASVSAATATSTTAGEFCAGAALYRPLNVEYSISKPFGVEVVDGDWRFVAAINFATNNETVIYAAHNGTITAIGDDPSLGHFVVIAGSAGSTMYAPITDITAAVGAPIKAGDVLGKATDGGFLHFSYIPKGDAFATATAVDPNPCFLLSIPGGGNSTGGTELPTCDPTTQPALAPNFAQLEVSIAPGGSKAVDSYLCTRGNTVASSNFDIALSVDLTGSFWEDLPIIKDLAPSLWGGLAAKISGLRMALTVFWDYASDPKVYEVQRTFTGNKEAWLYAVDAMVNGYGGDFEEAQLIAIRNMANETDGITWRSNAVRVMVLTTDAPFHTGLVRQEDGQIYDYGSMEETLQLLQSKNIKFIGICQDGCDAYQMDYLASGTGGSVILGASSDSADIINAITAGLSSLLFNIRPTVLPGCAAAITFTPEVTSSVGVAKVLSFRETISVPESVTDAVLKCEVSFTADSGELARQVITINTGLSANVTAGECRTIMKPSGVQLYSSRCNRTGYIVPNGKLSAGASVQVYASAGYLPTSCPAINKECWVYARDPVSGVQGWMPHSLPDRPQSLPCGPAPGDNYLDCCAGGAACSTRDLCVGKDCSNQGTCSEGVCRCNAGFSGDSCERENTCAPTGSDTICSGNGFCEETTSQCTCKRGFYGAFCQFNQCDGAFCGNGTCLFGECSCDWGYTGGNCTEIDWCRRENPCSGHGYCDGGWSSSPELSAAAATPTSARMPNATHLMPNATRRHKSRGGFRPQPQPSPAPQKPGVRASATAAFAATSGGVSTAAVGRSGYTCTCFDGWVGAGCEASVCEDSSYCSGHGTCNAEEGGCTCDYEWVGDRCDRPRTLCDPDPCNGHGTCNITDGSCECNLGWRPDPGTPSDCRYEYEDPCIEENYQCSGNGVCKLDGTRHVCECLPGWIDEWCYSPDIGSENNKCMQATADEGLQMYDSRCAQESYETDRGFIPKGAEFIWYADTGYRNASCAGEDSEQYCWIFVEFKSGKYLPWGWVRIERPDTPGACGLPGGGLKYAQLNPTGCATEPK